MPDELNIPGMPDLTPEPREVSDEISNEEIAELIKADLEKIKANPGLIEPDPAHLAAVLEEAAISRDRQAMLGRKRAQRSGMLRRLKRRYDILQPFTAQEAAERTNSSLSVMISYLNLECSIPGSQIERAEREGTFVLINPFD